MANLDSEVFDIKEILGKLNKVIVEHNPGESLRFSEPQEKEHFGPYWAFGSVIGFSTQVSDISFASDDGQFLTLSSEKGFANLKVNKRVKKLESGECSCELFDQLQIQLHRPLSFGKNRDDLKIRIDVQRLRYGDNLPMDSINYHVKVGPMWIKRDLSEVIRPELFFLEGYKPVK